jgi:hypothetical protein
LRRLRGYEESRKKTQHSKPNFNPRFQSTLLSRAQTSGWQLSRQSNSARRRYDLGGKEFFKTDMYTAF